VITDMLGNSIQMTVGSAAMVEQFIHKGAIVPLGFTGQQRSAYFPEVPTLAEQGLEAPYLKTTSWTGIVAPNGMPQSVIKHWEDVIGETVASPEYGAYLKSLGQEVLMDGPEKFSHDLVDEWELTNGLVKELGIEPV